MRIINLLPKVKQQEIKYEAILHGLIKVVWISVISFVLVIGTQFAAKLYLQYKTSTIESDIQKLQQQVNKQDNAAIKKEITNINNVVGDFKGLYESVPKWSNLLDAFAKLPPQGVLVSSLSVDIKTKVVTIQGYSPTRELVIELYNNILKDTEHFGGVDYPLENVAKATNNNFHFTFLVNESVLK